ncbi:hypothetical protein HanIR_Chr10g0454071 [Helianthus annuus]|nr:hypothetical protein HanIR_Chr10g0454071 [Helianthus annuus]
MMMNGRTPARYGGAGDGGGGPYRQHPQPFPPFSMSLSGDTIPPPFLPMIERNTTTTVRWWCDGDQTEERERERGRREREAAWREREPGSRRLDPVVGNPVRRSASRTGGPYHCPMSFCPVLMVRRWVFMAESEVTDCGSRRQLL